VGVSCAHGFSGNLMRPAIHHWLLKSSPRLLDETHLGDQWTLRARAVTAPHSRYAAGQDLKVLWFLPVSATMNTTNL
jgi:hypothetical protein